ncbi:hypothetical protein GCM10028814_16190 [Angustibacter aerolatus]
MTPTCTPARAAPARSCSNACAAGAHSRCPDPIDVNSDAGTRPLPKRASSTRTPSAVVAAPDVRVAAALEVGTAVVPTACCSAAANDPAVAVPVTPPAVPADGVVLAASVVGRAAGRGAERAPMRAWISATRAATAWMPSTH